MTVQDLIDKINGIDMDSRAKSKSLPWISGYTSAILDVINVLDDIRDEQISEALTKKDVEEMIEAKKSIMVEIKTKDILDSILPK